MNQIAADRELLRRMLDAAIERVRPANCLARFLPERPRGRTIVVGGGKAGGAMVEAFEAAWDGPVEGLVITRYGYGKPARHIRLVEAAHPVPDEAGLCATAEMLELVQGLGPDDLVICLLSGGGSALLTCPADGVTLADKQAVTRDLLRSGAPIQDINAVRRLLSAIKGGGLARAAYPARVVTLAISDVVNDDPLVIASGPTVDDPSGPDVALDVLRRWKVSTPEAVALQLRQSRPAGHVMPDTDYRLIARPSDALETAAGLAREAGLEVVNLGDGLEGEARDVACRHADMVRRMQRDSGDRVILSGGELTVTVSGEGGMGGPNREYALALALALGGAGGITAIAADTDGVEGAGEKAGAIVDPTTWSRARDLGVNLGAKLAANDSHDAFEKLGDLVATGPTFTNVNDFRAIIVRSRHERFHAP